MEKLLSFANLKIGNKVVEITKEGHFECWVLVGRDPTFNPKAEDKIYWRFGYFANILNMDKVERWNEDILKLKDIYLGFDKAFIVDKCIEASNKHIDELNKLKLKYYEN